MGADPTGKPLLSLFDVARNRGRAIGLASNAAISDTTPAAFYAKTDNPQDSLAIAAQLVDAANIDVILGGGKRTFFQSIRMGGRTDGRDLLMEMRDKGYDIVQNKSDLANAPSWRRRGCSEFFLLEISRS